MLAMTLYSILLARINVSTTTTVDDIQNLKKTPVVYGPSCIEKPFSLFNCIDMQISGIKGRDIEFWHPAGRLRQTDGDFIDRFYHYHANTVPEQSFKGKKRPKAENYARARETQMRRHIDRELPASML